jgi:hypothetical protein
MFEINLLPLHMSQFHNQDKMFLTSSQTAKFMIQVLRPQPD